MSVISSGRTDTSSVPALTRASTALNSNRSNLPTPDELPGFGNRSSAKDADVLIDAARIRSQSSNSSSILLNRAKPQTSSPLPAIPQESESSYFPTPVASSPKTPQRHRSTKELIKRFESMSTGSKSSSPRSRCSSVPVREDSPSPEPPLARPLSAMKGKGRSPLRNSLMNLITLFGKKGKNKDNDTATIGCPYEASVASTPPTILHSSPRLMQSEKIAEAKPSRSGPILYLSSPDVSSALPVWTNCKASLLENCIQLEWQTAFGNPASRVIMLERSADVHSLAASQVDPTEKILLPNMGQDLHIFEITYAVGPPEKFALPSVAERSAWVSCIWDALLHLGRNNYTDDAREMPRSLSSKLPETQELREKLCEGSSAMSMQSAGEATEPAQACSRVLPITSVQETKSSAGATSSQEIITGSEPVSVPLTLTRSTRVSSETLSLKRCSPSVRDLDNLSLIETQLSRFSGKQAISREPTVLSRRSTVDSHYSLPSRQPSVLITPKSLPRIPGRWQGIGTESELKASAIPIEDAIYDLYTQKTSGERNLPPLPDATEVFPVDLLPVALADESNVFGSAMRSPSEKFTSMQEDSNIQQPPPLGDNVHPLVALIQDHAVQQYSQTSDLSHQIASLQNDVLTMSAELRGVIHDKKPDSGFRKVLEELCMKMEATATIEAQGILYQIDKKVDHIQNDIIQLKDGTSPQQQEVTLRNIGSSSKDSASLLQKLEEKIDQMQQDMKERASDEPSPIGQKAAIGVELEISAKLDELISLVKSTQEKAAEKADLKDNTEEKEPEIKEELSEGGTDITRTDIASTTEPKLAEMLSILKETQEQKKAGAEQQAENARYLQELNTWLETFVNNGTSQIQRVAAGVEQLCKEVGPQATDQKPDDAEQTGGLRSDVNELMSTVKDNSEKTSNLRNMLAEVMETTKMLKSEQKATDMEAVIGIIDRQRQEQEVMLRNIAAELSHDIRGERLRFVEAMKEATAINVQVHVEEFKKELSREVITMTCEVGRLQRERQILEQQIADLFAFFAKQRAEMEQASRAQGPLARAATLRRPLPAPK